MRFFYVLVLLFVVNLQFAENHQHISRRNGESVIRNRTQRYSNKNSDDASLQSATARKRPNKPSMRSLWDSIINAGKGIKNIFSQSISAPTKSEVRLYSQMVEDEKKDLVQVFSISKLLTSAASMMSYILPYVLIFVLMVLVTFLLLPTSTRYKMLF